MDSATTEMRDQRKTEKKKKMEKSPTQAELDDFFSAAERYEQKRFTEKWVFFRPTHTRMIAEILNLQLFKTCIGTTTTSSMIRRLKVGTSGLVWNLRSHGRTKKKRKRRRDSAKVTRPSTVIFVTDRRIFRDISLYSFYLILISSLSSSVLRTKSFFF